MPSIRSRADNSLLFFDLRVSGNRCREQTLLPDTPINRKKLEKVLARIESEIAVGTFVYENYFPNSKALKRLAKETAPDAVVQTQVAQSAANVVESDSVFKDFANQWVDEHCIEWRRSHTKSVLSTINGHLLPHFGQKVVSSISKSEVLAFRATLAKVKGRGNNEGLSPKRINEIMGLLRQILNEAADRFEFTSPMTNIKKLKQRKVDVAPFALDQVQLIITSARLDFRNYFVMRFFTGMRTAEAHGLKWKYVDFEMRIILIRETFVLGEDEYTKTDGSQREIQMSQPVFDALQRQWQDSGDMSEYVFCNREGKPLDNKNFTDRVWYPLLRNLGMEPRRPYQMRHTAATLWLASGEAPEWIARQLGHTSTEMLFRIYSRYVPNLTRQDGSAMERLLASKLSQGALLEHKNELGHSTYAPIQDVVPPTSKPKNGQAPKSQRQPPDKVSDICNVNLGAVKKVGPQAPKQASGPGPIGAQAPPIAWSDLAQSWMSVKTDLHVNQAESNRTR